VLGDGLPGLGALIVAGGDTSADQLEKAVQRCNGRLPDYARITAWRMIEPFTQSNRQLTANGRTRREIVEAAYETEVQSLINQIENGSYGASNDLLPRAHTGN
jgi:hypothetical protein